MSGIGTPARRYGQRGGATVEYMLVLVLAVLVIVARPDLINQMLQAIREFYNAFVYAISLSSLPL